MIQEVYCTERSYPFQDMMIALSDSLYQFYHQRVQNAGMSSDKTVIDVSFIAVRRRSRLTAFGSLSGFRELFLHSKSHN